MARGEIAVVGCRCDRLGQYRFAFSCECLKDKQLEPTQQERLQMANSEDRKKAQENKFAHDSEMQFKARARRNKLTGLWAAGEMGLPVDKSETYAKNLVAEGLREAGDENLVRKLSSDFAAHGLEITETAIHTRLGELMAEARDQVLSES